MTESQWYVRSLDALMKEKCFQQKHPEKFAILLVQHDSVVLPASLLLWGFVYLFLFNQVIPLSPRFSFKGRPGRDCSFKSTLTLTETSISVHRSAGFAFCFFFILSRRVIEMLLSSPLFSLRSDRSWWGSAAWWRSPNRSQWPRSWRGCAGLSTSLWSSSQKMSFSMSPWTNGLCVTASSPSTLRVHHTRIHIQGLNLHMNYIWYLEMILFGNRVKISIHQWWNVK